MSNLEHDFVYLACPYSDPDGNVKEQRFVAVTKAAAYLMRQGHIIYSPITHCHPMEVHGKLPEGWKFWARIDETFMRHCRTLIILPLNGWEKSVGVKAEIRMAKEFDIPILFLDVNTYHIDWEEKTLKSKPTF